MKTDKITHYLTNATLTLLQGRNKSEIEVLTAILTKSSILPRRLKRHDNAINQLKKRGVIKKGKDNILRIA